MPSRAEETTWDFGPALALVDGAEYGDPGDGDEEEEAIEVKRGTLGDFDNLFELLGDSSLPPTESPHTSNEGYITAVEDIGLPQLLTDSASDQSDLESTELLAVYTERLAFATKSFEAFAGKSSAFGGLSTRGPIQESPQKTKWQRKKARRAEQKALLKASAATTLLDPKTPESPRRRRLQVEPPRTPVAPLDYLPVPKSAPPKPSVPLYPSAIQAPKKKANTQALISDLHGHQSLGSTGLLQIEQRPQAIDSFQQETSTHVDRPGPILHSAFLAAHGFKFGIDRHILLASKLRDRFYQDRDWLDAAMQFNVPRDGIHVFVDASNIVIGFYNELKRLLGYPNGLRNEEIHVAFDCLALLMERRRPVSKRVLVGSKPELLAFDIARKIGYETHILDKVLKIRELTEKQKYFKQRELDTKTRRRPIAYGISHDGPFEAFAEPKASQLPQQEQKWVEQGVDELLHLKMMQSLLDASDEPGTIVLATGDAAEAEYSDGFKENVERALRKGWKVELYSWAKNISNEYRKPSFTKQWKFGQFQIFELDEFARELLDC
ncbi:hypothetical protein BU16DRAFT_396324 [Lophium mytilinum]|uniref:NYN domain-containing protein n=1 Tax=Lophium mytilinum TaxID=390894 RepID=A0A6A6QU07_9PEZI|nr:hypothetical protein BU16DRAFT_396324 [Lophium mytilinum]